MTEKLQEKQEETIEKDAAQPSLIQVAMEIEEIMIKYGLGARDVLHVLREVETNATVALSIAQIVQLQASQGTDAKQAEVEDAKTDTK